MPFAGALDRPIFNDTQKNDLPIVVGRFHQTPGLISVSTVFEFVEQALRGCIYAKQPVLSAGFANGC
jgi:hypothetical protein